MTSCNNQIYTSSLHTSYKLHEKKA